MRSEHYDLYTFRPEEFYIRYEEEYTDAYGDIIGGYNLVHLNRQYYHYLHHTIKDSKELHKTILTNI